MVVGGWWVVGGGSVAWRVGRWAARVEMGGRSGGWGGLGGLTGRVGAIVGGFGCV